MKYPLFKQILPSCFSAALNPLLNERNNVGPNNSQLCWMSDLLRLFAHPFTCCCVLLHVLLRVVACFCVLLGDVAQTLNQQLPTFLLFGDRGRDRVYSLAQLFLHSSYIVWARLACVAGARK